jgi:hypothetical protein
MDDESEEFDLSLYFEAGKKRDISQLWLEYFIFCPASVVCR